LKKLVFVFVLIAGLVQGLTAQRLLTVREVFDFEVGDVFHYTNSVIPWPHAQRKTLIEKTFSITGDTVFYTWYHDDYTTKINYPNQPYTEIIHTRDTTSEFYTQLDSLIMRSRYFVQYDSLLKNYDTADVHYDSILNDSYDVYCDRAINGYNYALGNFEPSGSQKRYGEGIGLVWDEKSYGGQSEPEYRIILQYFQKNNQGCGKADVTGTIEYGEDSKIILWPNPVVKDARLKIRNNSLFDLEITDIRGGVISSKRNYVSEQLIDLRALKSGIYFIRISNNGQFVKVIKFVKQ